MEAGEATKHRTNEAGATIPAAGTQAKLEAKAQKNRFGLWKDKAKSKLFRSSVWNCK